MYLIIITWEAYEKQHIIQIQSNNCYQLFDMLISLHT